MHEMKDIEVSITIEGEEVYTGSPFFIDAFTDEITIKTKINDDKELLLKITKNEQPKDIS